MKYNSYCPVELDDLRKRNPNSLSQAERENVKKMPGLNEWRDEEPTRDCSRKRKLELSEQQPNVILEAEDKEPKLTQQEREYLLHEEMKEAVDAGIIEAMQRSLREEPKRLILTEDENKKVVEFAMIMGT